MIRSMFYGVVAENVKFDYWIKDAGKDINKRRLENDMDGVVYGINCEILCTVHQGFKIR